MNVCLHDTHFHLDLMENPLRELERIDQEEVYTFAVTNIPEVFGYTQTLAKESKFVRAALGFHPELAHQHAHQLPLFIKLLDQTRYIGEVGLDRFKKTDEDFAEQVRVFEQIVSACHTAGKKILTVHSRRAEKSVIDIIGPRFSGKVILHWYSGPLSEIDRALAQGFYFSINHSMTQSDNGKKIIQRIPKERLLLETDGPFIKIQNHSVNPYFSRLIADRLYEIKKTQDEIVEDFDLYNNFKALIV
jgi:TatD DNase family protein